MGTVTALRQGEDPGPERGMAVSQCHATNRTLVLDERDGAATISVHEGSCLTLVSLTPAELRFVADWLNFAF